MNNEDALIAHAKLLGVTPDEVLQTDDGSQIGNFRVVQYAPLAGMDDLEHNYKTFREAQKCAALLTAQGKSVSKVQKVMW